MQQFRHNIVNILYAIRGMTESHLLEAGEGRFRGIEERLRRAEQVLKRAYVQSGQALQMTKRLAHELQTKPALQGCRSKVSIRRTWRRVLQTLKEEFSFASIEVVERIPDRFPPIHCDRDELEEILYHLAKNAVQAVQGSGKIVLRTQLAFSWREEPFALIALSDTGPGIVREKLTNLFFPFFTTKPEAEGNGLGLYLTKLLVEKNHGRITASSSEGFGTTFTVEFPFASHSVPSQVVHTKAA